MFGRLITASAVKFGGFLLFRQVLPFSGTLAVLYASFSTLGTFRVPIRRIGVDSGSTGVCLYQHNACAWLPVNAPARYRAPPTLVCEPARSKQPFHYCSTCSAHPIYLSMHLFDFQVDPHCLHLFSCLQGIRGRSNSRLDPLIDTITSRSNSSVVSVRSIPPPVSPLVSSTGQLTSTHTPTPVPTGSHRHS